jgi:hypothetical protein
MANLLGKPSEADITKVIEKARKPETPTSTAKEEKTKIEQATQKKRRREPNF